MEERRSGQPGWNSGGPNREVGEGPAFRVLGFGSGSLYRKTRQEIRCFGKSRVSPGREGLAGNQEGLDAGTSCWDSFVNWWDSRRQVGRERLPVRLESVSPAGWTNCKQIAFNETDLPVDLP